MKTLVAQWKLIVGFALGLAALALLTWLLEPKPKPVEHIIPPQTDHAAEIHQIVNATVAQMKVLEFQAQTAGLLDEVKALHAQIGTLTRAVAQHTSTQTGTIEVIPGPAGQPGQPGAPGQPGQPGTSSILYQDYRLRFAADTGTRAASYTLSQRFEATHITGRDKAGTPVSLFRLVEVGPGETRTEIPAVVQTTVIDGTEPRWWRSLTIQVGAGAVLSGGRPVLGGLVAAQWWRRGRTRAAEDGTVALLSPAAFLSRSVQAVGVVPLSVNLGQIPHQPFRDIWLGPFVGWSLKPGGLLFGLGLMASF